MRQIERRIRALEAAKAATMSGDAIQHISDEDLDWLIGLPNDGVDIQDDLLSPDQAARRAMIWCAAIADAKGVSRLRRGRG
jgi:hypothetical protein